MFFSLLLFVCFSFLFLPCSSSCLDSKSGLGLSGATQLKPGQLPSLHVDVFTRVCALQSPEGLNLSSVQVHLCVFFVMHLHVFMFHCCSLCFQVWFCFDILLCTPVQQQNSDSNMNRNNQNWIGKSEFSCISSAFFLFVFFFVFGFGLGTVSLKMVLFHYFHPSWLLASRKYVKRVDFLCDFKNNILISVDVLVGTKEPV